MQQFRCFAAETGKCGFVAAEQRRRHIQTALVHQPLDAAVHNNGTGAFLLIGIILTVAQPIEKFLRVKVHTGGDLTELVKFLPVLFFQNIDQVLHQTVVHGHAVQKHLKGVLAGVGVGLDWLFRCLCAYLLRRLGGAEQSGKVSGIAPLLTELLRQRHTVLCRAGPDKSGNTHFGQLRRQLLHPSGFVLRRHNDAVRGGARTLKHLGHIAQIIVKKLHKRLLFCVV